MTKEEAIKYLRQLYPNGGHCWLDEQRIEAIGIAINALQGESVSEELEKVVEEIVDSTVLNAYGVKEIANRLRNTICDTSVSEDLGEYVNELSKQFPEVSFAKLSRIAVRVAKWQKEKLWKPADGDDLPEIDREVVVLIKYNAQRNIHDEEYPTYRVGFGHRPNPDGWDGKNIDTNVVTHYTPKLYDKGGWNAPNIVYWLDYDINELLCIEK